jgi:hypothetical protein
MTWILLTFVTVVSANASLPGDTGQHTGERATRLSRALFTKSVELILADRRSRCMNAFGSAAFCGCLNERLPVETDFDEYIIVATTPKNDLDYDRMTTKNRQTVDQVLETRDYCVARQASTTPGEPGRMR